MKKASILLFLIILSTFTTAQTGSWNILSAKLQVNKKWAVFGEAQIRSLRYYDDFHYYEYKAGVQYNLDKNFVLAAGFGDFDTYSPGGNFKSPKINDEARSWIQLTIKNYLQKLKIEHRYRAEQRFTSNGFRNRFRYRFGMTIPIRHLKMESKTFYVTLSDEIFLTNRAPYFERNRLFAGGGYEFSEAFSLQLGYMRQFDYRLTDETGRGFVQLSLLFDLKWKNQTAEKIPGGMD